MLWLALLLCCSATLALPLPDEVDSEETRKVLGSSVVTSVSVIMDLGNGTQAVFTNATGSRLEKPGGVGSPVDMATPDHYQYYSFDGSGNLIKRYMTKDDVSSIIATNQKHNTHKNTDAPIFYHSVPENIGDLAFETKQDEDNTENLQESQLRVVANVQNLLKSQMSSQGYVRPPMPTHISPEASASWSMILPSFFGNQDSVDDTLDQTLTPGETQVKLNNTEPLTPNTSDKTPASSDTKLGHQEPVVTLSESTTPITLSEATTPITLSESTTVNTSGKSTTPTTTTESTTRPTTSTESTIPITSSEPTTHITSSDPTTLKHKPTTSSAVEDLNVQESSSESQMLGDAPAVSLPLGDLSTAEESTELSSNTDAQPNRTTGSQYTTEGNTNPQFTETHYVMESTEKDQTEQEHQTSSTVYEIISTSNASFTPAGSQTTASNTQINSQHPSNEKPLYVLTKEGQHPQSSESHKSEVANKIQSNESSVAVTESILSSVAPNENYSLDSSAMLADSPVVDLLYKHSSTNSDHSEEVTSQSAEYSTDTAMQTPSSSEEEKEESHESQHSGEMEENKDADVNSNTSDEATQSASEEVSQKYEETVATTGTEHVSTSSTEQGTGSGTEFTDNVSVEKTVDSTENSGENSQFDESNDKQSEEQINSSTDSIEDTDNVEEQTSTGSTENVDNSAEKESIHSLEEIDNSKEGTSTESTQANSDEKTKGQSQESSEGSNESMESAQANSDEKTKGETQESSEGPNESMEDDNPTSDEKTSITHVIKAPEDSSSQDTIASVQNTPANENETKHITEQTHADSVYLVKLGETPNSDLANTLVISEENHSSFNQIDLSSSSSKEKNAQKTKNNTNFESAQVSTQDEDNKAVDDTSQSDDDTSFTSSKLKDPNNNDVPETLANSSEGDNSADTYKTDAVSTASNEEPNVSVSPVKTTDTSSSTPEVTEKSEEKVNGETSSEQSTEDNISGETIFTKGSTVVEDEIQATHNLDESVASIVSQITNDNINSKISQLNHEEASSDVKTDNSGMSSQVQENNDSLLESQRNPATEIVVTSVSTSKSTESSSSEVVDPSKYHLNEEGSGVNGLCGEDASCTEDSLNSSIGEHSDNDKVSAGSESVGITATFNHHGGNSTTESTITNNNDHRITSNLNLSQDTSKSTQEPSYGDQNSVTNNPLLQTQSTLNGNLEEVVTGVLTTTVTDRFKTDIDSLTTPSTLITESGEIIPISGESSGTNYMPKIDETIKLIPPEGTKKPCNKEGSGIDSLTDSCEDGNDGGDGSGHGLDSVEGSGYSTINSYNSGELIILNGHKVEENKHSVSGDDKNSLSVDDELHDIMKYATSTKDIGITNAPNYDNTSSESPVAYHDDLVNLQHTNQQFESSTVNLNSDKNESIIENISTSSNKPVHAMDLFEYINSDVDIGITNVYNSSESESTTEPSVTESEFNSNETSDQELEDDLSMTMFKYVNSDEDSTTEYYNESNTSSEELASTNSNEIEATTSFDMDVMMNEQPVGAVVESGESFIPYHEIDSSKNMNSSEFDKSKVTSNKPLPQKAQKDDTINNVKQKPHVVPSGQYPLNLVQQPPQKLKVENNTQLEDNNWTKVEVISHLKNPNSTGKPSHLVKPSAPEGETTHPPLSEGRPQFYSPSAVELHPAPQESLGLEASTANLVEDVQQFAELCNELAFKLWVSMTEKSVTAARSLVMSPFAITSLLSMIFLGAKGSTSDQMNDMLKLDDMMAFNPHQVFRNVTESVVQMRNPGVRTAAFVRELYSDKAKGSLLEFYKQRASQFYDGLVEEANFTNIGDLLRRRTNLQVKKQTGGRVPEYLRGSSLSLQPPLAAFSANIFQTDCRGASTQGRDGEMYFTILPTTRQRRLVPIPSAVFKSGFLAGYEPGLDATVVSLGMQDSSISTLFVMPGQQGQTAPGDGLSRLETRLLGAAYSSRAWSRLLRSLLHRPGLEVQFPRFSHRSLLNLTSSLQNMGINELFDAGTADLQGLSGLSTAFHVSDLVQINTFTTCGEEVIGSRHHVEIYPSSAQRAGRDSEQDLASVPLVSRPRQARVDLSLEASPFEEAVPQEGIYNMPLALRPRQARLPDSEQPLPRLKFDRPFLYFVRHNPTGFILHMGRFNPRLIH